MRTTSQCSPGVRARTAPTPSTWPCIMWPPSLVCAVTARSRLTGVPSPAAPRLLRRRVSSMTSVDQTPSVTSVTVRQTPFTAIESPRATSCRTRSARIPSTAAVAWPPANRSSRTTRVPTSSTIPVNTSTPSVRLLVPPSVPGGPEADLHVPAQAGDVDDREGQRVGDRADSQVPHQRGTGAEKPGRQVHQCLVDETCPEEGGSQRRAALQQHAADATVEELGQQLGGGVRAADQRGRGVVQ